MPPTSYPRYATISYSARWSECTFAAVQGYFGAAPRGGLLMSFDLSEILVVGISSRALFDLRKEDRIFQEEGLEAYSKYQIAHEQEALAPGAAFSLARALLHLNKIDRDKRRTEVVVMSRNNADTSLRIFNSIKAHGLDITRAALTSGAPLARYSKAFEVDLFLSAAQDDVQMAVDAGFAAARIYLSPPDGSLPTNQLRIAFDGDAVIFSEESELIHQADGLDAFQEHERQRAAEPMSAGPFAGFLRTLSLLQREFPQDGGEGPIRTALITARNSPAHERVIRTLRAWDVRVDEAFFLGGASKDGVLRAFGPHIFFDDQARHLEPSAEHTAVAQVPLPSQSDEQFVLEGTPELIEKPKPKRKRKPKTKAAAKPAEGSGPPAPPSVKAAPSRSRKRERESRGGGSA